MNGKSLKVIVFAVLAAVAFLISPPFFAYWRVAGLYEIYWYGWWWLPFVAIAYCSTRYFGLLGFISTILIVSVMVVSMDVHWIFEDMRDHPENQRDADFVFWFGVLCRLVLFNLLLVPVGILGRWVRARRRQVLNEPKVV